LVISEGESADRTGVRPAYPRTPRVLESRAPNCPRRSDDSSEDAVSSDVSYALRTSVRPAYARLPDPIKGMRGCRPNLLISFLSRAEALRFNPRSHPKVPVFISKFRRKFYTPKIPENPGKSAFSSRSSAQFSSRFLQSIK